MHTTTHTAAVLIELAGMLDDEYHKVHHRLHNLSGFIQALEFKVDELAEIVTPAIIESDTHDDTGH